MRDAGLPLTLNAVVHRHNLARLDAMIALAVEIGAERLEIAHVQYYGWALREPRRAAADPRTIECRDANGRGRPRPARRDAGHRLCRAGLFREPAEGLHGGWGRRFLNVTPTGRVLPCHAAETLPGLVFPTVIEASLEEIWYRSAAFARFRGTAWMPEPCRSCEAREIDWGGCRCQAFALTGDAARTDPACALSPDHFLLD